jgi:hypothetical protein
VQEPTPNNEPTSSIGAEYTAVMKRDDAWWIGRIEEVPGLREALQMNRQDARTAAGKNLGVDSPESTS